MDTTDYVEDELDWHPHVPTTVPTPGFTLRETLDALGMSQSKLATRTGITLKHINQIIQGNAAISPATAVALERATDVPASLWNNLEASYQDHKVRTEEITDLAKHADWLEAMKAPISDLRKRGLITATKRNPGRLIQELLAFFGVANIAAWETSWDQPAVAFLQSNAYDIDPAAVAAWLRLGEIEAKEAELEPFDKAKLKALLPELRAMTVLDPQDFYPNLVTKLASAGVCLVLVPDVAGTRASGATRFLSPTRAVVQLSNRGKRNDKFWFALFHEIGHLLLHSKKETFMRFDDSEAGGHGAKVEEQANDFAGELLIPTNAEADLRAIRTPADAKALAAELGIAPGIVVGRHQRETRDWKFGVSLFQYYEIGPSTED